MGVDGVLDVGHVTRYAFYFVDDERMDSIVNDAVGPAFDAKEKALLIAHALFVNVEASGVWVEGVTGKEDGARKRYLCLVGIASCGLQRSVDVASGLHCLDAATPIAV